MPSSLTEVLHKNTPPFFEDGHETQILINPSVVKTFLRFANILFVCSRAPMTISEIARILGRPAPRVSYQVKQLVKADLLQCVGQPGRGARYLAKRYWTIPHTALQDTTFQDFLVGYFERSIPVFVSACAAQMKVNSRPWHLDFDLFAPDNFKIRTDEVTENPPLISQCLLRLSEERAAELNTELTALLRKYDQALEEGTDETKECLLAIMLAEAPS